MQNAKRPLDLIANRNFMPDLADGACVESDSDGESHTAVSGSGVILCKSCAGIGIAFGTACKYGASEWNRTTDLGLMSPTL